MTLKSHLEEKIPRWRIAVQDLVRQHGQTVVDQVTLAQLFRGLRGVTAIVCDTSFVDPVDGLYIRGIPVMQLTGHPAESVFYLLCTGALPSETARAALQADLVGRRTVPEAVWPMLDSMPADTHPMTLLSMSMLAMQGESLFTRRYGEGLERRDHWEATLEDALNIIARLPVIAAGIYRRLQNLPRIPADDRLDFSDNFAHMLGLADDGGRFREFLRGFVVVHSDHEGANASVLTSRVVNSTLSDLYYSISGAMNCLAGPLHGLANQESLRFVQQIETHFGGVPSSSALTEYLWEHLQQGRVVPGFGHAVLREADPRYVSLYEFGLRTCATDPLFRIVKLLGEVVPPLLKRQGKAKNPNPNIDGISGALLYNLGMRELQYYTVMFSTAQVLGICAQLVINRALSGAIIRPKSVTTRWLQGFTSDVF